MATITHECVDSWTVVGKTHTLLVTVSLDDVNGALYHVYDAADEDGDRLAVRADVDAALEWAEEYADR